MSASEKKFSLDYYDYLIKKFIVHSKMDLNIKIKHFVFQKVQQFVYVKKDVDLSKISVLSQFDLC